MRVAHNPRAQLFLVAVALAGTRCGEEDAVASLPVAQAGFDRVVAVGTEVRFDGGQSYDPGDKPLTFRWSLTSRPAGSQAQLLATETAQPRLTPDRVGTYVAELVVRNGQRNSGPDIVAVRATGGGTNRPPLVVVGCGACTVGHGDGQLTLISNQTTDPNDPVSSLTFAWSQVTAGCDTLCPGIAGCMPLPNPVTWTTATSIQNPTFTAPDAVGSLVFRLVVTDPGGLSGEACLGVAVTNLLPWAIVPSPPATAEEGAAIQLNGASSTDQDAFDSLLSFTWNPPPSADLIYEPSNTVAAPTVRARYTGAPTNVQFTLTVADKFSSSSPCDAPPATCGGRTCCAQVTVEITDAIKAAAGTCYFDSECSSLDCDESAHLCQ